MKASQLLLLFAIAPAVVLGQREPADSSRTISIKMLNSKTGEAITTSEFQIWIGESASTARTGRNPDQWVKPGKDAIGSATFKPGAEVISVHAQDPSSWGYVNCDEVKPFGRRQEQWYSITQIIASGIAAPNHCSRSKAVAKPGEFIFFVRPMNFWEKMHE